MSFLALVIVDGNEQEVADMYQGDGEFDTFFSLLKMRSQPLKVWTVARFLASPITAHIFQSGIREYHSRVFLILQKTFVYSSNQQLKRIAIPAHWQ